MTFLAILQDCYRRLNYSMSPVAEVVTRIKANVNETHEAILSDPSLVSLLYGTVPFASVASRARYGISSIATIRTMTEATNDQAIDPRSLSWYRQTNPDPANNEGTPAWYIPLGIVAVTQVPAVTGTGLWVVSSSASDTAPTVSIDAIRVGGYPHSPAATLLTGTTRAQVGGGTGLTDYIDVSQFALSTACAGDISLYDAASAGNLLAVIPRGATTSRYWGFLLSPTPADALDYTLDVEHEVGPLVADTDEPLLPPRFHRLLAIGARVKEYEKTDSKRYATAALEYETGLKALKYTVTCPPGYVCVPSGPTTPQGSNLGPMFPPGRW